MAWPAGSWHAWYDTDTTPDDPEWFGSLLHGQKDGSGLVYMRNRYYDPQSGQFTQQDPIGLAGGLNLYGFANGDPVNFSDPFGLCPVCLIGAAWAAFEIGSGIYDAYNAVRTVFSDASAGEKAVTVGLAVASIGLPGGGYTAARLPSRLLRNKIKRIRNQIAAGGNRGVSGAVTASQAQQLGEAFVGPGFRSSADGNVLISEDGLRQFRLPSAKSGVDPITGEPFSGTGVQVNFEARVTAEGPFTSNVHLDVRGND